MRTFAVAIAGSEDAEPIERPVRAQTRAEAAARVLAETEERRRGWRRLFLSVERR